MRATDEATLARRAAGGDGQAFAQLYDQYEQKIFNFCLRLVANRDDAADATQDAFVKVLQRLPSIPADRELNFGAYLFTAARNASYDVIGKRKRADAVDEIPERGAKPLMGDDVGDVLMDPERAAMLSSFQSAVQEANGRLPERQREVLALRELDDLSYDEIAEIMDMNRNSVAQLISRARIKLRDELRGSALASVAVSSAECERALPLIAKRQDGQLKDDADAAWLDGHLGGCETCQVSVEAMAEAGMSYRAWAPVIPMAWLWKATAAHAMERTGHDFSDVLDRDRSHLYDTGGSAGSGGAAGAAGAGGAAAGGAVGGGEQALAATAAHDVGDARGDDAPEETGGRRRRRAAALLTLLLLLLLGGGVVLATADDTTPVELDAAQPAALAAQPTATVPAAPTTTTPATPGTPKPAGKHRRKGAKARPLTLADLVAPAATTTTTTTPTTTQALVTPRTPARKPARRPASSKGSGGGSKVTGSAPKPVSRPTPAPTTTSAPPSTPPPPPASTTDATPPPPTTTDATPPPPPTTTTTTTTTTPPPTTTTTPPPTNTTPCRVRCP